MLLEKLDIYVVVYDNEHIGICPQALKIALKILAFLLLFQCSLWYNKSIEKGAENTWQ